MSLHLIDSDEDFNKLRSKHQPSTAELPSLKLSLTGGTLPDATIRRIEVKINQILHAKLTQRPEEPKRLTRPKPSLQNIAVNLDGIPLANDMLRLTEREIQTTIFNMLELDENFVDRRESVKQFLEDTCICASAYEPGHRGTITPPTKMLPWKIGWILPRDVILIDVLDASASNISTNQMLVGLKNETSWPKELVAYHRCFGILITLHRPGFNTNPIFMTIDKGCQGADTVVLRRPGFIVWDAAGFLDFDSFWKLFGGKKLIFTWKSSV